MIVLNRAGNEWVVAGFRREVDENCPLMGCYTASAIARKSAFVQHRQCTYKRNIEARSRNHCCRGKAVSITYSWCLFVDLGTEHATRMHHIVICGLSGSTAFFHIIS